MKIAITIENGNDLSATLDPRFGRCGVFLFVDTDSGEVLESRPNTERNAAHGAGIGAAALVGDSGAEAVISGRFGPKAMTGLEAKGVAMYAATPGVTASEALEQFRQGKLEKATMRQFR